MKRLALAAAGAAALAVAGLALADGIGIKSVKSVTADFTATKVLSTSARTCTNTDGTFVLTRADYDGTATSSDPSLNGPLRLQVTSLINTGKNLGTVSGRLRIDTSSGPDTVAGLNAVYSGGQLNGFAAGRALPPYERLLANVSAGFGATGGFTSGKIGGTAGGGAAVELAYGRCEPGKAPGKERVQAKGSVSAVSATSITVAGVTCAVPPILSSKVLELKMNDQAEIRCEFVGTVLTLVKVEKKHGDDD